MKPILIEITEPITIDQLRECVEKAYEAGKEDGKRENQCQFPFASTTPHTMTKVEAVPCTNIENVEMI